MSEETSSVSSFSCTPAARPQRRPPSPVFRNITNEPEKMVMLRDVDVNVALEFGRARMRIAEVLNLSEGAVLELDKSADEPVDVFVNDMLVARGEAVVIDGCRGVRITEIVRNLREEPPKA